MQKTLFIDTHAHLDDPRFDADREEAVKRALDAGLKNMIVVGCWNKERGFQSAVDIIQKHPFIYGALGVHPHDAKDVIDEAPFDLITRLALSKTGEAGRRIVAIGETGLDYHYDNSPREAQRVIFKRQISLARELNLPLVIHSREAEDDTLKILKGEGANEIGGVFHCFSGSERMAEEALKMGFYISFTGVVTFPKADNIRSIIKKVPIEKTLIETDCPYLTPEPHRGKRNEPSFVVNTARTIAEVKGLTIEDVARVTTLNAEDLFALDASKERREVKIAYRIRDSLYLNITNRCTNYCTFCAKFKSYTVKGHYLRLREEPGVGDILSTIGPDPNEKYEEVVFCGFGEPLIRLDVVKDVGMRLKKMGCRIRIDTDGLANLVHGRNVLPELRFVDSLSVSMNAPDSVTYQKLVRTPFGERAHPAIIYFLREAKKYIAKVVATVVAVPGLDVEACRKVAEEDIGVGFRVREYDNVG